MKKDFEVVIWCKIMAMLRQNQLFLTKMGLYTIIINYFSFCNEGHMTTILLIPYNSYIKDTFPSLTHNLVADGYTGNEAI